MENISQCLEKLATGKDIGRKTLTGIGIGSAPILSEKIEKNSTGYFEMKNTSRGYVVRR